MKIPEANLLRRRLLMGSAIAGIGGAAEAAPDRLIPKDHVGPGALQV